MKNKLLFFILFVFGFNIDAQNPAANTDAYKSGEFLKYSLSYGWITAGYATFSVEDSLLNGVNTEFIEMKGISAGVLEALYKIRDTYTTFIDPEIHQPIKSIRDIREGKYRYYNEVTFDYSTIVEDSITIQSKKSGEHQVPYVIQDILSSLYYCRRFEFNDDLKVGEIIALDTYFGDELYPLKMKFMGIETVKTKNGKIESYLFHPVTEVGRAFKTEDDMKLWISRDKNRIPALIKMNLKVGSFVVELIEYKNLANPFSSKK
ncbi:DUF3108 domain-containing protein [Saccharicrinis aurantiacus]|uniref:DUF3108 domain-containing protein n=1 Tax=Saccharicrinis aurantiacus TaxID=1849719 RepID=UPI002491A5DD|nr:DUF3108 domain-containing protein [Saccharicrinis aurantiacus]